MTVMVAKGGRERWRASAVLVVLYLLATTAAGDTVRLHLERGTWMSVAVDAGGQHLLFDHLGEIRRVPVAGGEAKVLISDMVDNPGANAIAGRAVAHSPALSANGDLVFVSDRTGTENLWVLDHGASVPRQLTDDAGVSFHSPTWAEGGRAVLARRSTNQRSGELWRYPLQGGPGKPVASAAELPDIQGPAIHGNRIYVAAPILKDDLGRPLRRENWQVFRLDERESPTPVTAEPGGAVRPRISPDGQQLAYATWRAGRPALVVRNLDDHSEVLVHHGVSRNLEDMYIAQLDLFPGYAFAPDGSAIHYAAQGRLWRLDLASGARREISFELTTEVPVAERAVPGLPFPDDGFQPRILSWPSAAGSDAVVVEALGRLWRGSGGADLAAVTSAESIASQPDVGPDGTLVYVQAGESGRRHLMLAEPGQAAQRVGDSDAAYAGPRLSADGLLAIKGPAAATGGLAMPSRSGDRRLVELGIGADERTLASGPFLDAGAWRLTDGRVLAMTSGGLVEVDADGTLRTLLPRGRADLLVPSPDGSQVAIAIAGRVLVASMGDARKVVESLSTAPPPHADHPGVLGRFPTWIDEDRLLWSAPGAVQAASGGELHQSRAIARMAPVVPSAPERPMLLRAARILTMATPAVIDNGEVLVCAGRIRCVGPVGDCPVPEGAEIRELGDATLMPGLIDVHEHALALQGAEPMRVQPASFAPAALMLAYGVTSTRDPALLAGARDFALIESINAGRLPGPRYFASGERVMPERFNLTGPADAAAAVADLTAWGATSIKSYLLPDRRQRQWLRHAAAEQGVRATFEGGFDYKLSLGAVLDGYDGIEHSAGNHPIYGDFINLMARTDTAYTPTILTQIGAERFFQRFDVGAEERLQRFVGPRAIGFLQNRARRGQGIDPSETSYRALVASAARAAAAGVTVGVGAHDAPAPTGLGTHWELWAMVEGGMSPVQALAAATIDGARIIGITADTGSIEAGKAADLLVLEGDPLQDIRETLESLQAVMRAGWLYDSKTLAVLNKPRNDQ